MNWGIVGQGSIAQEMATALQKEHQEIYAVAGRHMEKVNAFAQQYHVTHSYTIDELLQDEAIDIVYIATPHTYHYEYLMKALQQGKHVLCEKAITVNQQQLETVLDIASKNKLIVMEAMTIFHMPIMKQVKAMIEEGAIGKLKMIQVNFGSCKAYDVNNRFFSPELAGGALLDIGTYAVSFARYFMKEQPNTMETVMLPFETGVDEMSGILLRNEHDEMATITLTMRAKLPKKGIIAGDQGYIEICEYPRGDKACLKVSANGEETLFEAGLSEDALCYEIRDMEEAVRTKVHPTLALSKDVTRILHQVRKQWGIKYPFE